MPYRSLGDLERAVMDVLWAADERWLTVRQVFEELATSRDIAYTTAMTVLDRLAKKGLVLQHREGRAYRYRPSASRGVLAADLMRDALRGVGDDERGQALVAFVGEATEQERTALREALAALEAG